MAYTTDPVADLLTRIRNANRANHATLEISASKLKLEIVKILHREGFIKSFELIKQGPQDKIKITLKYGTKLDKVMTYEQITTELKRISKPSLRVEENNTPFKSQRGMTDRGGTSRVQNVLRRLLRCLNIPILSIYYKPKSGSPRLSWFAACLLRFFPEAWAGDIEEEYREKYASYGCHVANVWYIRQLLRSVGPRLVVTCKSLVIRLVLRSGNRRNKNAR